MESSEQIQLHSESVLEREVVQVKPFSPNEFWAKLRRRKVVALTTFLIVTLLGLLLIATTDPLYRATTQLLIAARSTPNAGGGDNGPLNNLFAPTPAREVDTQVEVLQSADLLQKTADRIGVDRKAVRVDVRQIGKTDLVELSAISNSRAAAEKFAKVLPQIYLQEVERTRLREVSTALGFARQSLAEKSKELERREQVLKNFKIQSGIVNLDAQRAEDISAASVAQATSRQARAEAASAAAQLNSLRASRARLPSTISAPVTTTNPEVALLKERIAALREERARLLFNYKPASDEIRKVDVSIAALERRLANTPRTTTTVTRSPNPAVAELDAKIADTQAQQQSASALAASATASAARLQDSLNRYNRIEAVQSRLQRAVEQGRESVDLLSKSVEQLSLRRKAVQAADAPLEIVAAPGRAEQIAPRFFRSLLVTLLLATLLACVAAFARDAMDSRIYSEEEAGALLGVPILGRLQHSKTISKSNWPLTESLVGDSYYQLWSNVQFAMMNCADRVLQITSTVAGEGATMTAVNLAMETALGNRRVILVDANFHEPQLHSIFHLDSGPGLADVLAGRNTLEESLQHTTNSHLKVLTAGARDRHDAVLLGTTAMDELLAKLSVLADFVIFDSAPTSVAADAAMLASKTDGVLYVTKLGAAERQDARSGLETLRRANANIVGVAINESEYQDDLTFARYVQKTGEMTRSLSGLNKTAGAIDDDAQLRDDAEERAARQTIFDDHITTDAETNRRLKVGKLRGGPGFWERAGKPLLLLGGALLLLAGAYQFARSRSAAPNTPAVGATSTQANISTRVADVLGAAWQKRDGKWQPLQKGATLKKASVLRTGKNAALLVRLGTAGVLRVGPETQIQLNKTGAQTFSANMKTGKVWALVKEDPQASRFVLTTPAARLASDSGLFSAASGFGGNLLQVSAVKGRVVASRGSGSTPIAKGQALRINAGQALPAKATALSPAAREMWHRLHEKEKWPTFGGALELDAAATKNLRAAAK
jgi:capsular exopolysaccharide synthesis family protein